MKTIAVTVYSYRLEIKVRWHDEEKPILPKGAIEIFHISKSVKPEDDVCEVIREIDQEIKDDLASRGLNL